MVIITKAACGSIFKSFVTAAWGTKAENASNFKVLWRQSFIGQTSGDPMSELIQVGHESATAFATTGPHALIDFCPKFLIPIRSTVVM